MPDTINLNGYRARFTLLTHPSIPASQVQPFNGHVAWIGVTCNTVYECIGGGPFTHRRIIFSSSVEWPACLLQSRVIDAATRVGAGEFIRPVVQDLNDPVLSGCLRTLFQESTVRGTVHGPVSGVTAKVLVDEKFCFNGNDDGVRKTKKFWNSLKNQPVMKYRNATDGSFTLGLQNSPDSQHIYLVDIFSYGLVGLDSMIPNPRASSVPSGSARASDKPDRKRPKSDETEMSGMSDDSLSMSSLSRSLLTPTTENEEESWVKVLTEMKLYYKQVPL